MLVISQHNACLMLENKAELSPLQPDDAALSQGRGTRGIYLPGGPCAPGMARPEPTWTYLRLSDRYIYIAHAPG